MSSLAANDTSADGVNPVLALSILDGDPNDPSTRIMIVVRDPATNHKHSNVVSVPTARIPPDIVTAFTRRARRVGCFGRTDLYESATSNSSSGGHDPLIYAASEILARKLGAADLLERQEITFVSRLVAGCLGDMRYEDTSPERIQMLNVELVVTRAADQFVPSTASYSHIMWVTVDRFLEAVKRKHPDVLGLSGLEFCIHGLCISTSYDYLAVQRSLLPFANLADSLPD
jgi:hypothetical protein